MYKRARGVYHRQILLMGRYDDSVGALIVIAVESFIIIIIRGRRVFMSLSKY